MGYLFLFSVLIIQALPSGLSKEQLSAARHIADNIFCGSHKTFGECSVERLTCTGKLFLPYALVCGINIVRTDMLYDILENLRRSEDDGRPL